MDGTMRECLIELMVYPGGFGILVDVSRHGRNGRGQGWGGGSGKRASGRHLRIVAQWLLWRL